MQPIRGSRSWRGLATIFGDQCSTSSSSSFFTKVKDARDYYERDNRDDTPGDGPGEGLGDGPGDGPGEDVSLLCNKHVDQKRNRRTGPKYSKSLLEDDNENHSSLANIGQRNPSCSTLSKTVTASCFTASPTLILITANSTASSAAAASAADIAPSAICAAAAAAADAADSDPLAEDPWTEPIYCRDGKPDENDLSLRRWSLHAVNSRQHGGARTLLGFRSFRKTDCSSTRGRVGGWEGDGGAEGWGGGRGSSVSYTEEEHCPLRLQYAADDLEDWKEMGHCNNANTAAAANIYNRQYCDNQVSRAGRDMVSGVVSCPKAPSSNEDWRDACMDKNCCFGQRVVLETVKNSFPSQVASSRGSPGSAENFMTSSASSSWKEPALGNLIDLDFN